ncbi:MAG TPA: N-acetylmuramoyl-L-alanine amidase [Fimbriimonadales bacterium]|jgi:N-acetylmuramoyl-L-alanine amidase|nr:N-acetylmuramoyl-L-alanine amidase [Fimbriimonadales bacterium]
MLALLGTMPWMAMSLAAAIDTPVAVTVTYCHFTPAFSPSAIRVGEECYIPAKLSSRIGWKCSVKGDTATVLVDGRKVEAPAKLVGKDVYIPVKLVADSIGAITEWSGDQNFRVFAKVFSIAATPHGFDIKSTLRVKTSVFAVKSPDRVVADVQGARIDPQHPPEVVGNVRYSQFNDTTVRVVVELDAAPFIDAPSTAASLVQTVKWKGGSVMAMAPVAPNTQPQPIPVVRPAVDNTGGIAVGKLALIKDLAAESILTIPTSADVGSSVTTKKDADGVYWIDLPKATISANLAAAPVSGVTVKSAELQPGANGGVRLRMELSRPMGVKVSTLSDHVEVHVIQPKNAFGSLASKTIVVDAGHGGQDVGSRFGQVFEKNLTLPIAKMVADELARNGTTVLVTRDDDTFIGLNERPKVANRSNAAFFVSIHINSNSVANSQSGTFTYYHMDDPDSKLLAECIQAEIAKVSGIPNRGIRSDRKEAPTKGFAVLRGSEMPAVLVEVAYINSATDRKLLQTWEFKDKIAKAIVKGIRKYIGEQED